MKEWCATCGKVTTRYARSGKCRTCATGAAGTERLAKLTAQERRANAKRQMAALTPEQRRAKATKASHARTPEHFAAIARANARPGRGTPAYSSWRSMRVRCLNPNATSYAAYGGRGITIDPRWVASFEAFLADMGERPPGTTLDRIDVNGNYEPGNCRWADARTQRANRRPRLAA